MFKMSEYSFIAGLLATGLALVTYLLAFASVRMAGARAPQLVPAGGPALPTTGTVGVTVTRAPSGGLGLYGTLVTWLAFAFLTASLIFRAIHTGHGPFANMYEFSIAFAWGTLGGYLYFERRYRQRVLALIALPVALGMMLYATTIPATAEPLVPALQNNLLLSVHVAVAIVAYGTFSIAFGAALLHLIQPAEGRRGLPKPELLDEIGLQSPDDES